MHALCTAHRSLTMQLPRWHPRLHPALPHGTRELQRGQGTPMPRREGSRQPVPPWCFCKPGPLPCPAWGHGWVRLCRGAVPGHGAQPHSVLPRAAGTGRGGGSAELGLSHIWPSSPDGSCEARWERGLRLLSDAPACAPAAPGSSRVAAGAAGLSRASGTRCSRQWGGVGVGGVQRAPARRCQRAAPPPPVCVPLGMAPHRAAPGELAGRRAMLHQPLWCPGRGFLRLSPILRGHPCPQTACPALRPSGQPPASPPPPPGPAPMGACGAGGC